MTHWATPASKKYVWDRRAIRDKFTGPHREWYAEQLKKYLPDGSWHTPVDQQEHLLTNGMLRFLRRHCGTANRLPIKEHLTPETWTLICAKKEARKRAQDAHQRAGRAIMAKYWAAWLHRPPLQRDRQAERECAIAWREHNQKAKDVHRAVRQDDKAFYAKLAAEAGDLDRAGKTEELWQQIRPLLPKQKTKRKQTPLRREDLATQWTPHFAELEMGEVCTEAQLRDRDKNYDKDRQAPIPVTTGDLPTRTDIERAARRLRTGKAAGPDQIPPELLRYAADIIAPTLHHLYIKILVCQKEPLAWKGGTLYPIYKKGPTTDVKNHRGILVQNVPAKPLQAWLRQRTMEWAEQHRHPMQLGGFSKQQVQYGSQATRLHLRICEARGLPGAVLFLDISSAFHHLLRHLLMGDNSCHAYSKE